MPGAQELLVIAVVALFVLGPERLPALARSAAKLLTRVRTYGVSATQELRGMADLGDIEREVNQLRRELGRTRSELRQAMRETITPPRPASAPMSLGAPPPSASDPASAAEGTVERAVEGASDRSSEPVSDGSSSDPSAREGSGDGTDDVSSVDRGQG